MNKSSLELLTPNNCTLALIDHQPQMFFGVASANRATIIYELFKIVPFSTEGMIICPP